MEGRSVTLACDGVAAPSMLPRPVGQFCFSGKRSIDIEQIGHQSGDFFARDRYVSHEFSDKPARQISDFGRNRKNRALDMENVADTSSKVYNSARWTSEFHTPLCFISSSQK
jgi:hypothetical protein